jgi:heat shock protein 4
MVEEVEEEEPAAAAESKEEAKDENGEKKKKLKRTNLEYSVTRPLEWSKDEISKFHEAEVEMANQDRVVRETADMRNELESYIYDMRDKLISESQLGNYSTQSEKDKFNKKQEEVENWLYEDGFDATKSVYAAKLGELKKVGGPVEARASEAFARPNAIASLHKNVEKYKTWMASAQGNEKFAHITDEDFGKCHALADKVSSWAYDMLDKQGSLPQDVDPAFTVADVNAKNQELTALCSPIMHRPAPKKKKEEPKKEEKPKEEAPADPMETEEAPEAEKMDTKE